MADDPEILQLTIILVKLMGRLAYPEPTLRKIILRTSKSANYLRAYNLCDGTKTRIEVAKAAGLDKDNFNKRATKWIQQGILFEVGSGRSPHLLHLYPLSSDTMSEDTTMED